MGPKRARKGIVGQMLFFATFASILVCFIAHISLASAQPSIVPWKWITGSKSITFQDPVYGTKRVANTSNSPGARDRSVAWYNAQDGEFWVYGGNTYSGGGVTFVNDLWRFRKNDSTWTWMSGKNTSSYGAKGVASVNNLPDIRQYAAGWYDDTSRELWMFGGGVGTFFFNDLWRFRLNDSTWTWMSGNSTLNSDGVYGTQGIASTANYPGAREPAAYWFHSASRELWLFGGRGYASGTLGNLNDLWRYRLNDSTWMWMSGSNLTTGAGARYGILGVPSTNNRPGARQYAVGAYDAATPALLLFGGIGNFNDLWRYQFNDSTWTWLSGLNGTGQQAVYGTKGVASSNNRPGARYLAVGWYDTPLREFWVLGGIGASRLNDLWRYRMNDSTWTWMSGTNASVSELGVYGTQGVASTSNYPGTRGSSVSWYDEATREMGVFGGNGEASNQLGRLGDMFVASLENLPPVPAPVNPPQMPPQMAPVNPPQTPPQAAPVNPPQMPPQTAPVMEPQMVPEESPMEAPANPPQSPPQLAPVDPPQMQPQMGPMDAPRTPSSFIPQSQIAPPNSVPSSADTVIPTSNSTPIIVGTVFGALALLGLCLILGFLLIRRRRRSKKEKLEEAEEMKLSIF